MEDYLFHRSAGWTKKNHKYISRTYKNGRWIYDYGKGMPGEIQNGYKKPSLTGRFEQPNGKVNLNFYLGEGEKGYTYTSFSLAKDKKGDIKKVASTKYTVKRTASEQTKWYAKRIKELVSEGGSRTLKSISKNAKKGAEWINKQMNKKIQLQSKKKLTKKDRPR